MSSYDDRFNGSNRGGSIQPQLVQFACAGSPQIPTLIAATAHFWFPSLTHNMKIKRSICLLACGSWLGLDTFAATFTVTSTNDSGAGSLRQIITDANAAAGADAIQFQITTINLIRGNYIRLNAAGGGAVGNFANGVLLSHAPANGLGG